MAGYLEAADIDATIEMHQSPPSQPADDELMTELADRLAKRSR